MRFTFLTAIGLFFCSTAFSQDDLLKQLEKENKQEKTPVIATFKTFKIINLQTNETVKKRNLDFRVAHLFGNIGEESGGGFHNLYGIDQSADIRIGFHYGITDKLTTGISRAKRFETYEGFVKYKVLEQSIDDRMPFSLGVFGQATVSLRENVADYFSKTEHRFNYTAQVLLARKFSGNFSAVLAPTWVHRNVVDIADENDLVSLGLGARIKLTKSSSIIADYFYTFNRSDLLVDHFDPLGLGFEVETGGHVFSLMFTNASGTLENDFIPNTVDSWGKGGMKLSFNISRTFKF